MMLYLFYGHSLFFTVVLIVGGCVGIALMGQWVVHRLVPLANRRTHNDVIGYAAATSGLIFAVLLGFIASTVWVSYDRADSLVNQEASLASDLFNDAPLLPPPFPQNSGVFLRDYAKAVVNEEWPNMAKGEPAGKKGWPLLRQFYFELGEVSVVTPVQVAVVQEMLTRINQLYDVRRERLRIASRPSLNPVIWFVVLAGGLLTIGFCWLFGFEKKGLHKTSTAMIAASLGLVVFLMVTFNYPFRGRMQISPAPFEQVVRYMDRQMQKSAPPETLP